MEKSIQARLRAASHPSHVRINNHPMLESLTEKTFLLSTYRTILIGYFHLYGEMEMQIKRFTEHHPVSFDYSARTKLAWLEDDLHFLNGSSQIDFSSSASPIEFPAIQSIGQLIGVLYPIEGSTLGGQVISRHLKQNHGLTAQQGARFFNGYGTDTRALWEDFCRFADTIESDSEQYRSAEAATLLTFKKFEETLNEYHQSSH